MTENRYYNKHEIVLVTISGLLGTILGYSMKANAWETGSIIFTIYCFGAFIQSLGRELNIKHLIALIASIQYLLMPAITYTTFDKYSDLGALWQTFMVVDSAQYFRLALPGTILLWFGLHFRFKQSLSDRELIQNASEYLSGREVIGFCLLVTGIVFSIFYKYAPPILYGTLYFFTQLTFIGALYLAFGKIRIKKLILLSVMAILIAQSIITGMYGEMVFWTVLGLIILSLKSYQLTSMKKYGLIALGLVGILLIQSVKHEYREKVWDVGVRNNDPGLWLSLVRDRITNPETLISPERLYKMTVRGNQGQLIGRIMNYVPKHEPFANGQTIVSSVVSAIIPRVFWPGKPMSGGKEKTCRFMGACGERDYSYNIGQLGEAYVNFGMTGGAMFMFFYGLFINYFLVLVKRISIKNPSLILWAPLLFYSFLSLETDYLTSLNTFIKGVIFYIVLRYFFLVVLKMRI